MILSPAVAEPAQALAGLWFFLAMMLIVNLAPDAARGLAQKKRWMGVAEVFVASPALMKGQYLRCFLTPLFTGVRFQPGQWRFWDRRRSGWRSSPISESKARSDLGVRHQARNRKS